MLPSRRQIYRMTGVRYCGCRLDQEADHKAGALESEGDEVQEIDELTEDDALRGRVLVTQSISGPTG
jgi:hypothetical protein